MDAQRLAQEFLGDSIVSNILAMGYAWQRGLVPVGLAAMLRAIELNSVAVASNKAAFSLGRLAAADPAAVRELLHEPVDPATRGRRRSTSWSSARRASSSPTRTRPTPRAIGASSRRCASARRRSPAPTRRCR